MEKEKRYLYVLKTHNVAYKVLIISEDENTYHVKDEHFIISEIYYTLSKADYSLVGEHNKETIMDYNCYVKGAKIYTDESEFLKDLNKLRVDYFQGEIARIDGEISDVENKINAIQDKQIEPIDFDKLKLNDTLYLYSTNEKLEATVVKRYIDIDTNEKVIYIECAAYEPSQLYAEDSHTIVSFNDYDYDELKEYEVFLSKESLNNYLDSCKKRDLESKLINLQKSRKYHSDYLSELK